MGLVYPFGAFPTFKCTNELPAGGYVLKLNSDGTLSLAAAADEPFAINVAGVVDFWNNPISNPDCAVVYKGMPAIVELQLYSNNLAIAVGDKLCISANQAGVVDLADGTTNTATPFAIALEAKAAKAGGTIKAVLIW